MVSPKVAKEAKKIEAENEAAMKRRQRKEAKAAKAAAAKAAKAAKAADGSNEGI